MNIIDGSALTSISEPGVYANLPSHIYHSNCTPTPALSSSGARLIASECPAVFWWQSPLNPDRPKVENKAFDIGSAAHLIILEPELFDQEVAVISVPKKGGGMTEDYKTDAAQEARDTAREAGKIPLLPKERDMVQSMRAALRRDAIASRAFTGGRVEVSIFWQDQETGVWLKARPDFLHETCSYWADYKTTTSANPDDFSRKAYSLGYHAQDAWLTDAVSEMTGITPRQGWFVAQDKSAPFLSTVHKFPSEATELGRAINRKGIDLFAKCLRTGDWHGFRQDSTPDQNTAFIMNLPGYLVREFENQGA